MRLDPIRRRARASCVRSTNADDCVVDPPQPAGVDVAVDLGRRERRVAEQLLDRAQVGAALEQVGRVRVTQPVRVAHQPAEGRRVERAAADREKQRVVCASREGRARVAEVGRDRMRRPLAERHDALLAALAEHVHRLLLEVDVCEVKPDDLGAAQAAGVGQLEDRGVADRQCRVTPRRRRRSPPRRRAWEHRASGADGAVAGLSPALEPRRR